MGLKNLAHFIGIIRGNFIELRDYDDIQDLKDGTKIIIFYTHLRWTKSVQKINRNIQRLSSIQTAIRN